MVSIESYGFLSVCDSQSHCSATFSHFSRSHLRRWDTQAVTSLLSHYALSTPRDLKFPYIKGSRSASDTYTFGAVLYMPSR